MYVQKAASNSTAACKIDLVCKGKQNFLPEETPTYKHTIISICLYITTIKMQQQNIYFTHLHCCNLLYLWQSDYLLPLCGRLALRHYMCVRLFHYTTSIPGRGPEKCDEYAFLLIQINLIFCRPTRLCCLFYMVKVVHCLEG